MSASQSERPLPPVPPEPGDCCQGGCHRCVYDGYWDAFALYEEALKAWDEATKRPADAA